jgi:tetratricopeptide (TPR) repeat protein
MENEIDCTSIEKQKASIEMQKRHDNSSLNKFKKILKEDIIPTFSQKRVSDSLNISEDKLNSFLKPGSNNLTLTPSVIIQLWYDLVYAKPIRNFEKAQERLKQQGPDPWLKLLGYVGTKALHHDVPSNRLKGLKKVVSTLCPRLLTDSDFEELVENIIHLVEQRHTLNPQQCGNEDYTSEEAIEQVKRYIDKREGIEDWQRSVVIKGFEQDINSMTTAGKKNFGEAEVVGLLRSIDWRAFRRARIFSENRLGICLLNCQFTSPVLRLEEELSQEQSLEEIFKFVRPLIKATVTCKLRLQNGDPFQIQWRYTSTNTYLANLVIAVGRGLGWLINSNQLQTSVKLLGQDIDGLADVRVTLRGKEGQVYKGQWVAQDTVLCLGQSLVVAIEDWLYETFQDLFLLGQITTPEAGLEAYLKYCKRLVELRDLLQLQNIYEYRVSPIDYSAAMSQPSAVEDLLQQINQLEGELQQSNKTYSNSIYANYLMEIPRLKAIAYLQQARAATTRGALEISQNTLDRDDLKQIISDKKLAPFKLLYEAEQMVFTLSTGMCFETDKHWGLNLKTEEFWHKHQLDRLINPARVPESEVHYDYPGVDAYLAVAELYGNAARLNFYNTTCQGNSDRQWSCCQTLERTAQWFLIAACYLAQAGYEQRSCHWLCMASRTHARLGNWERSKALFIRAEQIGRRSLSLNNPLLNRSYLSEINLAKGECLLHQGNQEEAMIYLLKALLGATYRGFGRRMADSLYGIARAAKQMETIKIGKLLESPQIYSFSEDLSMIAKQIDQWKIQVSNLDEDAQQSLEAKWFQPFEQTVTLLQKCDADRQLPWSNFAQEYREAAQATWQNWSNQVGIQHDFQLYILNDHFLDCLKDGAF